MKIHNKRELQSITINNIADIDYTDLKRFTKIIHASHFFL